MKRTILMAQGYEKERRMVEQIVDTFDQGGEIVHEGRNTIKHFKTTAGDWNVKRYHKPIFLNRIVYSFFRKPKGLRAFTYPVPVISAGFETPRPVAYIEERQNGLIGYSYFISEQCNYGRRMYEFGDSSVADNKEIFEAFARYTASLHEAGIYHRDYSPGNILFDCVDGQWHFSIVDINRMEFGEVSVKKGCENFARLWAQPETFRFWARIYAEARKANPDECEKWVMDARNKFWKKRVKHFDLPYKLNF